MKLFEKRFSRSACVFGLVIPPSCTRSPQKRLVIPPSCTRSEQVHYPKCTPSEQVHYPKCTGLRIAHCSKCTPSELAHCPKCAGLKLVLSLVHLALGIEHTPSARRSAPCTSPNAERRTLTHLRPRVYYPRQARAQSVDSSAAARAQNACLRNNIRHDSCDGPNLRLIKRKYILILSNFSHSLDS